MTRNAHNKSNSHSASPGQAATRAFEASVELAVERLRMVARMMVSDDVDAEGMNETVQSFFAACAELFAPTPVAVDLEDLMSRDGIPAMVLSALYIERVLLGRPIVSHTRDGEPLTIIPDDLESVATVLDELVRLDPYARAERYIESPEDAAMGVGIHLAREGDDEIFPLEPWTAIVIRRCLAAAAITTATLSAAELAIQEDAGEAGDPEPEHQHEHRHADLDGLIHVAAAAVDALDDTERDDISETGFGTIAQVVEDLLSTATDDLEPPAIRHLSARLVATFMRGFSGVTPEVEIVETEDPKIARILAAADVAGRMAAERLGSDDEPSPFQNPRALLH